MWKQRKVFILRSCYVSVSLKMDTPHLVDVADRPRLEFKRHPFKSKETDPIGALSIVPYGALHVEDVISFYH